MNGRQLKVGSFKRFVSTPKQSCSLMCKVNVNKEELK